MNKLRTFFYVLRKTFTSIEYYGELLKAPFGFSLKFFLVYFFFYAVVATGVITYTVLLPMNDFFTAILPSELAQVYPDELEITLKDGAVSTNVSEPYFIPLSSLDTIRNEFEERVLGTSTQTINNLLVIDTMARVEDFPQYQTAALLTKHHLSVMNEDGNIETMSLSDAENFTLNKQEVLGWVDVLTPYLDYIVPLLIGFTFIGFVIFLPIGRMIYLLILALVLQLVSKLMSRTLLYKKAYQLGFHLVVISTTFFGLWSLVGVSLDFPYLEMILLTVLGGIVIKQTVKSSR